MEFRLNYLVPPQIFQYNGQIRQLEETLNTKLRRTLYIENISQSPEPWCQAYGAHPQLLFFQNCFKYAIGLYRSKCISPAPAHLKSYGVPLLIFNCKNIF